MEEKRSFFKKVGDFLAGKGFYIALASCLLVVGVAAWALIVTEGTITRTDVAEPQESTASVMPQIKDPVITPKPEIPEKNSLITEMQPYEETVTTAAPQNGNAEEETENTEEKKTTFMWPVYGDITVGYFADELVYNPTMRDWRTHKALDIAAEIGTQVMAVADGTVTEVCDHDLMGTTVVIDHGGGLESVYSNLAGMPTVTEGDSVLMGSVIGAVGNTAIGETIQPMHLHFEMKFEGVAADPGNWLPAR